ncbi:MAG: MBL fold metallo-hydrolase [Clostridiaceae bacterium]|nr:MBL fold metallo-hydrolase [Clostridiaceae bacterium]
MTGKEWFRQERITDDIILLDDRGQSSIYLVKGSERSLLIDTGWGIGDLPGVAGELTDKPLIVVNTHGHPDHVGGNYQFDSIFINKEDELLLKGCFDRDKRSWAIKYVVRGSYPDGFSEEKWVLAKAGGIVHIQENHIFDLGNKTIEVIPVPGHSPGSIALLDRKERMLFTGDSIIEGDIWMYLDESAPLEVYLSSLKRLSAVSGSFDMLLPAHCRAPIPKTVISELIRGVEGILDGSLKGMHHKTFAGEGLLCRFETCGIIYNENKLLSK